MAKEKKMAEWLMLQTRWNGEQLRKRRQRGETTPEHDLTRLIEWMALIVSAAYREHLRREALAQQVIELNQQIVEMKQQLTIVQDLLCLEHRE